MCSQGVVSLATITPELKLNKDLRLSLGYESNDLDNKPHKNPILRKGFL
jgi:hypothetical protein